MLPSAIKNLLRFAGLVICAMLAVSPWLVAGSSHDPFLNQGWLVFCLAALSICILSVVFLFYRPRDGHFAFVKILLLIFISFTLTLYFSNYFTTLRTTLLWLSYIIILGFLRLARQQKDNFGVALLISLGGFFMAVYCLAQKTGLDFFHWVGSPYSMVGTLSNPNYLGAYLLLTSVINLGLVFEGGVQKTRDQIILLLMFLTQVLVIFLSGSISAILALLVGIFLTLTTFWEVKPGRILKLSPLLSGAILAVLLTIMHGICYYSTSNYPWQNLASPPHKHMSVVSRLMVWQMGYSVFLNNPVTGIGPGAMKFAMPAQRPNFATALGLKLFNDDPHSAIVSLLAETGISGLFAIATLVIFLLGISIRKRSKEFFLEEKHETDNPQSNIYWLPAIIPLTLSALLYKAGLINLPILFFSIPTSVVFAGLTNSLYHQPTVASNRHLLSKTPMIAIAAFVFHSTFNNNLTVIPLLSTITVIAGLLLSSSLRDVRWKKRFSFFAILFLCLPLAYSFAAYNLQNSYQKEQMMLFSGARLLEQGEAVKSQQKFEAAIKADPQSLRAYFGLAMSLKKQNQLDEAQNIFEKLNSMVANVFNTNFELARLLFERKHFLEAHRYALKSLEWNLTPANYELLGKILLSEGKTEEARKIFKEGLVFIPDHKKSERLAADRIRLHLAAIAANSSNYDLCQQYLEKITSAVRNTSDALYLHGLVLSQKKQHKSALELFERALIESPNNPRIMNAVGFILVKKEQNLDRAKKLLETAHHLIKNSETPMLSDLLMVAHSLGILYWKQGQLDKAEKLLEIAWTQSPTSWKDLKEKRFNDLKEFLTQNNRTDSLQRLKLETSTETNSNLKD